MNSKSVIKSAGLIGIVVFALSALHGAPVKADSERNRSIAEQAKSMMAKDKGFHDSVVAAIKAKNATKVQSLFAKAGLSLPKVQITNQCCVMLPPFPNGPVFCCNRS